jgi:hypothetical protein
MVNETHTMDGLTSAGHAEPKKKPAREPAPAKGKPQEPHHKNYPPDSIRNPMPGLDPQQTPGIDRFPENED